MPHTVILISGGNRGLGLGLVKRYLSLPNHTVITLNRDPSHPTSQALADLPRSDESKLVVVKYDASIEGAAFKAVKQVVEEGIVHLDLVIANAAIAKVYPFAREVQRGDMLEHYTTNVLGPIELYQATRDLLQQSPSKPTFVMVGSGAGSLGRQPPIPNAAYGASKSVLPWYGVRINAEDEWLNAFVIDPGWVQTEMGNAGARHFGISEAPVTEESSVNGMFSVLTTTTKKQHGGKIVSYTGEVLTF